MLIRLASHLYAQTIAEGDFRREWEELADVLGKLVSASEGRWAIYCDRKAADTKASVSNDCRTPAPRDVSHRPGCIHKSD